MNISVYLNPAEEVVWSENPAFFRGPDRGSYTPLYGGVLGNNLDPGSRIKFRSLNSCQYCLSLGF